MRVGHYIAEQCWMNCWSTLWRIRPKSTSAFQSRALILTEILIDIFLDIDGALPAKFLRDQLVQADLKTGNIYPALIERRNVCLWPVAVVRLRPLSTLSGPC
jgi:hypothetical protein